MLHQALLSGKEAAAHVVGVSRFVWEWVVEPGWLGTPAGEDPTSWEPHAAVLYSLAAGLFPLVPRLCALAEASLPQCSSAKRRDSCAGAAGARREAKSCVWALRGLLCGGHIGAAEELVGASGWGGLRWPAAPGTPEDRELREGVRADAGFARDLCLGPARNVEALRWGLEWMGRREPWELRSILPVAMVSGNAAISQWLVSHLLGLGEKFGGDDVGNNFALMGARGMDPTLAKWWVENFSVQADQHEALFVAIVGNKLSSLELCQWAKDRLEITFSNKYLEAVANPQVLRWILDAFSISPDKAYLNAACRVHTDLEVIKSLVTGKSIAPTVDIFLLTCSSPQQNVELLTWLSQKVTLSPEIIRNALVQSLGSDNIVVADWIESTYRVMNLVNSTPTIMGSTLVEICHKCISHHEPPGLTWFLKHIVIPQVEVSFLKDAIIAALRMYSIGAVLALLQAFPMSWIKPALLNEILGLIVSSGLTDLKRLYSIVPFSQETAIKCCTSPICFVSSKVIKWFVTQFHLLPMQLRGNNNILISRTLLMNKIKCSEWLIDMLGISLHDLLKVLPGMRWGKIELSTWKFILRKFPTIDSDTVRSSMLSIVTTSPYSAIYTINKFPEITREELAEFWVQDPRPKSEIHHWLSHSSHEIQKSGDV
ncbi:hypothetical protein Pelo_7931 [Pelomyxa schiedti]|nr:hypothetical protein Pelo_7931 [Pelomyxa schiedti]